MSNARSTILEWIALGALPRERLRESLDVAELGPGAREWRRFLEWQCLWLGATALAASVVFFVAANWQTLGRFARFGMVEIALVAAVAIALWRGIDTWPGKAALVVAALLTGALLALVGQVYQTGADTFELFGAWAIAIVAWVLVARVPALWAIWFALINLAVFFWFEAVPGRWLWSLFGARTQMLALFVVNVVALLAWEIASARAAGGFHARWVARVLAVACGVPITILAVWGVIDLSNRAPVHLLLFALWLFAVYWAYRKRSVDLFILSGAMLCAVVFAAVALARLLFDRGGSSAFLLMGLTVVVLSALGARWLRRVAAEEGDR